jgi:hypothetical protein
MSFKATTGLLVCLFFLAHGLPVGAAEPEEDSNPYAVISERNVFHLNPIPPPPPAKEEPKADLPTIKLSGFLRIGKMTHALFVCNPKEKKDLPIYFDLADGEKEGILEVVKIHEDKGEVDIINSGTPATLSLKNDSLEPKAAPPVKGAEAKSDALGRPHFSGGADHIPGRSAYRTPVGGQGGQDGAPAPAFPMPSRRARVPQ